MIRTLIIMLVLPLAAPAAVANSPMLAGVEEFRAAYRAWEGDGFARAAATLARACAVAPDSATNQYWLGTAEFHRALFLLGERPPATNRRAAAQALSRAVAALQRAVQLAPGHGECHALLSTVYGLSIAANPLRAVWLGPRVVDQENLARRQSPDNPRVLYLAGMNRFYGPALLGGKRQGLAMLLAAEARFAAEAGNQPRPAEPRWGRGTCLVYIGKTYDALGNPAAAEQYFRKALALNPQDNLARSELENRKK